MVDANLKVWLLEVNASPSMSTKGQEVLKPLVKGVMTDLAKVIVDYRNYTSADTGGFLLIHKAKHQAMLKPTHKTKDIMVKGKKFGTKMTY